MRVEFESQKINFYLGRMNPIHVYVGALSCEKLLGVIKSSTKAGRFSVEPCIRVVVKAALIIQELKVSMYPRAFFEFCKEMLLIFHQVQHMCQLNSL